MSFDNPIMFFSKQKRVQNVLFGLLLLFLSIRIGKSVYAIFTEPTERNFIILQVALSACFLIGITFIIGITKPYIFNKELWNAYAIHFIYGIWGVYILMSGYILKDIFIKLFTKHQKCTTSELWLVVVFIGNLLIYSAYLVGYLYLYLIGTITFSVVFYGLLIFLLFKSNRENVFKDIPEKYASKKIEGSEAKHLSKALHNVMLEKQFHKNTNIKLKDIAKELGVFTHKLSQLLNDNLGKSFALFVFAFLLLCSCGSNKEFVNKPPEEKRLQQVIDSIYKAHPTVTGIMVHVEAPNKQISWSGAVGISDKEKNTPIHPQQPALIASVVKSYTSFAILKLIEQGKLTIDDAIKPYLTDKTRTVLSNDNYQLDSIKIKHLLTHTSGIHDYIDEDYMTFVNENKKHRWTRDEQITLATKIGDPLGKPAFTFQYADVNYLLLTEIIENITQKPFYTAMRKLLNYKENNINHTWFYTLEEAPKNIDQLVHQYAGKRNWDSYNIDPSFDLYGAGGIASTTKDVACFYQSFFNRKIVKNKDVLDLVYTNIETIENNVHYYHFGIMSSKIKDTQAYGHGGFWGTVVQYLPKLNTSIAVFVLERDQAKLRKDILESLVEQIKTF